MEQVRTLSTFVIADSVGVRPVTTTTELCDLVANIDFCWFDLSVGDEFMQLLLGTIDQAISRLDTRLHEVREQLRGGTAAVEFTTVAQQLQTLQSRWANFDRYSSAVRSALVGVEAVSGITLTLIWSAWDWNQRWESFCGVRARISFTILSAAGVDPGTSPATGGAPVSGQVTASRWATVLRTRSRAPFVSGP